MKPTPKPRSITATRPTKQGPFALPDFLIIGAAKAGTTSLWHLLRQHPKVIPASRKEVHFFDGGGGEVDAYTRGPQWYASHFPAIDAIPQGGRLFEASPRYIFDPRVPKRLRAVIPDVKLVIMLRDPVERAISHYFHSIRMGVEHLGIRDAMRLERDRLKESIGACRYKSHSFIHHSYQLRGHYLDQITRFTNLFPPDQLLMIQSESLFADCAPVLRSVFEFVGVDPGFLPPNTSPKNIGYNRNQIPEDLYDDLRLYFQPLNHELYRFLDRDFGW